MNEEKIAKLIKGSTKADVLLAMEYLRDYSDEDIKAFFAKYSDVDHKFQGHNQYFSPHGIITPARIEDRMHMRQGNRVIYTGGMIDEKGSITILLDPNHTHYDKDYNL